MPKCPMCNTDFERGSIFPNVVALGLQRLERWVCWSCFKQLLDLLEDGSKVAKMKGTFSFGIEIRDAKPK